MITVKLPLTGTFLDEENLLGDPADPVRVLNLDLGRAVGWNAVDGGFDFAAGTVEVELAVRRQDVAVLPGGVRKLLGDLDVPEVAQALSIEPETDAEFTARETVAVAAIEALLNQPLASLYAITGEPQLRRPQG